jgi:hypothetical protein
VLVSEGRGRFLVVALRTHTPKHIKGGWSHYTDTTEPVDVMGLKIWSLSNPGFEPATFRSVAHELTNCSNRVHRVGWALYLSYLHEYSLKRIIPTPYTSAYGRFIKHKIV